MMSDAKPPASTGWKEWLAQPLVVQLLTDAVPLCLGLYVSIQVLIAMAGRLTYPYDLEWMEGGMLAHAWRVQRWLPLYVEPNADWIPYIYPPGYPALLALLSTVTGLSTTLGRAVSVFGTLSSCAALVFAGWRLGPRAAPGSDPRAGALSGGLAAMVFLAAYPDTGAFYDLVRPDALGTALLAWSLVLGIDRNPRLRVLAGVLLAAAFSVKHNMAAYGVPMALGIWARFGWRQALVFGAASAGPALTYTGVLQLATGGHFLTTLLGVPGAHPMATGRFLPATLEELGKHMVLVVVGASVVFTALTARLARRTAGAAGMVAVVSVAIVVAGLTVRVGHGLSGAPRMPRVGWWTEAGAWAGLGLGLGSVWAASVVWPAGRVRWVSVLVSQAAALLAVPLLGDLPASVGMSLVVAAEVTGLSVGAVAGIALAGWQGRLEGRWVYGAGVCAMALLTAGLMRAHHGGFLNVYIPMHLVLCLALTMALTICRALWPRFGVVTLLGALVVAAHLNGKTDFDPDRYVPNEDDVAAGDMFVEALKECEGPVLSPFNPWLPVMAGHAPSYHLIALWDIDHRGGPYFKQMQSIRSAAEAGYWGCVVGGSGRQLGYGIKQSYTPRERPPIGPRRPRPGGVPPIFMPRTGWRVHPAVILTPTPPQAPN